MATLLQVVSTLFPPLRRDFNYFSNSFNSVFNYFQDSECYPFRECCALRAGEAGTLAKGLSLRGMLRTSGRRTPVLLLRAVPSGVASLLGKLVYTSSICFCYRESRTAKALIDLIVSNRSYTTYFLRNTREKDTK